MWQPASLGKPSPPVWNLDLQPSFLRLVLPGRWVRRFTVSQARAALPKVILETAGHLERVAVGYWGPCLDHLDQALDLAIKQIRAAWERGACPSEASEPPAGAGKEGGCPICSEAWQGLYGFFIDFQHQLATGEDAQERFRAAHGLCPGHLWFLERFASPRGLCAGLPALVEDLARQLAPPVEVGQVRGGRRPNPGLARAEVCPACQTRERVTQDAVERLARGLGERAALASEPMTPAICLQHLPLVVARVDQARGEELARVLASRLAHVAEAMAGFALKFDARRRDLLSDAERDAYREALEWLAGNRNLLGRFGGDS